MKTIKKSVIAICSICFVVLFITTTSFFANTPKSGDKITVEEVINKHLESIGTKETRKSVKSILIVGKSEAIAGAGKTLGLKGISVLASQAEKNMIAMKFDDPIYPIEIGAYDGSDYSVGYVSPGVRSALGLFLFANEQTFKNGLMGGTLSTSWELLNFNEKKGKLSYDGTKTVDGVELHRLRYSPKKNSDLEINLFFDIKTFRHIRTEYSKTIAATMGTNVDNSAGRRETRYYFAESFADFKSEKGLMLPHTYTIELKIYSSNPLEYKWIMNLDEFTFNSELGINQFQTKNYQ